MFSTNAQTNLQNFLKKLDDGFSQKDKEDVKEKEFYLNFIKAYLENIKIEEVKCLENKTGYQFRIEELPQRDGKYPANLDNIMGNVSSELFGNDLDFTITVRNTPGREGKKCAIMTLRKYEDDGNVSRWGNFSFGR